MVSIVIPCYKGDRYLAEAIESCLQQTHRNLEVIVVDDASPDRCAEIAENYRTRDSRVQLIRHPVNKGVSEAFNTGFGAASGMYMTRLAQDDLFRNDAIEMMVRHLESHPDTGLIYCDYQQIDGTGQVLKQIQLPEAKTVLSTGNKVGLCVMWRRNVWEATGGFDTRFDTAEDFDFWLRVNERFKIARCPEGSPLFVRVHSEMGSKVFSARQEILGARLLARHAPGKLRAARIMENGFYNAAFNSSEKHDFLHALQYIGRALCHWPFDYRLFKLLGRVLISVALQQRQGSKP